MRPEIQALLDKIVTRGGIPGANHSPLFQKNPRSILSAAKACAARTHLGLDEIPTNWAAGKVRCAGTRHTLGHWAPVTAMPTKTSHNQYCAQCRTARRSPAEGSPKLTG